MLKPQFLLPVRQESGRFAPGASHSPATQFKLGQRSNPRSEIKPGQRLSPSTEFRPGHPARNKLPVGSVTVRTLCGVRRAFVKIAEPNVWRERAKVEWERANGQPVPAGLVVHHKDRNSLNDGPDNLVALTRKQHALEHLREAQAAGFGSDDALLAARRARSSAP